MFSIDFSRPPVEILSLAHSKLKADLPEWERTIWQFAVDWFEQPAAPVTVFTSGSTGAPKSIEHTKAAMLASAKMTGDALNLQNGNTALLCLPANKISGMMMLVRSIYKGLKLWCIRPSVHPLQEIDTSIQFDFAAFTPMQFSDILVDAAALSRAQNIRKVILGGEEVPCHLQQKISTMTNEVYSTFGMTETISHIAFKRLNGTNPEQLFTTLTGVEIETGSNKQLIIHAPELGVHHLETKDIIQKISEREFHWLGRMDNVINRGGVKVYPEQIEEQIRKLIPAPFFISEINSGANGVHLALIIEGHRFENTDALLAELPISEKLHRPTKIIYLPQFIRTESGKIKRKETMEFATKGG